MSSTLLIFGFVYLAMFLGRVPGLQLDRTGAALIGAIALVALEKLSPQEAWLAVDVPSIALLLGMMIVSAQLRMGGFYTAVSRRIAGAEVSPNALLGLVVAASGGLSAVLANDIVCLAMTPILLEGAAKRRINPLPLLLALAAAANVGSAATLIGNPQNILIGQTLRMDFAGYIVDAIVPSVVGLGVVWAVIAWMFRGRWEAAVEVRHVEAETFNPWQTAKGLTAVGLLMGAFLLTDWPRDVLALAGAGVLMCSRKMASRQMLGLVDWQLLVLFVSLFMVNAAMGKDGSLARALTGLAGHGLDVREPVTQFLGVTVLSNLVSNVPAVMLLLPWADGPMAGPILALASTLAGNLIIVGSIANIIVVTLAADMGYRITWKEHARVGVPITLATLGVAGAWLWVRAMMM
ncbi:MAG: hypothetical protein IT442_02100 [Phycisphaeraceae bacterium]|nr:hypothetical protein [Phycisphaeraceae bacterium]